jgi:hypothetical protein
MENTWWGMKDVVCPKCETIMDQGETHFSADGQIRFWYSCPGCKMTFPIDYFASQLQAIALNLDLEKRLGIQQSVNQTPILTTEQIAEEDRNLERSMGIDPGEEGQR